jgi:hypothetical protein
LVAAALETDRCDHRSGEHGNDPGPAVMTRTLGLDPQPHRRPVVNSASWCILMPRMFMQASHNRWVLT